MLQQLRLSRYKKFMPLLGMLIFPFLGMMYAWVNKPGGTVYNLQSTFDQAIPFVKYFALPYSIWIFYIYVCVVYFFKRDVRVYYRAMLTYTVSALICYAIYSVFQTTVPRPEFIGNDVFTRLVAYIYHRDQPFNCFPSIHVFSSYMVFRLVLSPTVRNKRAVLLIGTMSGLIILSTLFIKQHVIADVIAGVLLVEIVVRLIMLAERKLAKRSHRTEMQNSSLGA